MNWERQSAWALPIGSQAKRYGSSRPSGRLGSAMHGHRRGLVGQVCDPKAGFILVRVLAPADGLRVPESGIGRLKSIDPGGASQ